jgi:hypothetical protein
MVKKLKVEVKESADYDNYLGEVKDDSSLPTSLGSFMEDGEDGITEEADIEQWRKHWKNMPAFTQENNQAYKQILMSFRTKEDYEDFQKKIGQRLTEKTKSTWHPLLDVTANSLLRWMDEEND